MKKIKEPNLQIIKFESMDVIATSGGDKAQSRRVTIKNYNNVNSSWY